MSTPENFQEARSSVAVSMTAKGDATVTVKIYEGSDATELERIRQLAVELYNATARDVRVQTGSPS